MSDFLMLAVTVLVSASLMMHMGVIALQATVLVIESVDDRALTRRFFYPALLQNIAVAVALLGFAFGIEGLPPIGALLLVLGLVTASGRPHPSYRTIELPLLVSGLLSLSGLAVLALWS